MASTVRAVAGVEVPVVGCEKIKWIQLSVPSSHSPFPSESEPFAPSISQDVASCHVIDSSPPAYLFWRIHQNLPNVLEVYQIFACKETPDNGLHLVFQDELSPFAFICANESAGRDAYLLYALTVSGIAYLLNLRRSFSYTSGSNIPASDVLEAVVIPHIGKITSVAATLGCLLTGHADGSIGCHQLGKVDPGAQGFMSELRDDMGIGRLWNLMSRGRVVGSVQDMVVSEHFRRKLLFVLHSDGSLRIWDFLSHSKIFNYNILSSVQTGVSPSRLCVGDINHELNSILLAVLHGSSLEPNTEMITVCNFGFTLSDKLVFSSDPTVQTVSLDQGRLIDMKISLNKLWILKEDDFLLYDLSVSNRTIESTRTYALQEEFVADQLFQGSENDLDDMIWTNDSILSSLKDQSAYFISSIFLRRLMQPGVYQSDALRATVLDHKRYTSDFEFQSLTLPALKKEIFAMIESEGAATTSSSIVVYWKNFCKRFFHYWCQNNTPYGLLVDSSNDVIGLIRKSSFSIFRSLEVSERLMYGTCDNFNGFQNPRQIFPADDVDSEFVYDLLRCTSYINQQLGSAAVAVYYESLITPAISSDDIFFQILKIVETGYSPSLSMNQLGDAGEKKQLAHKNQRKFSVDMFLSLKDLYGRAGTWARVFNIVDTYLKYLSPKKRNENLPSQWNCSINSSLLVQSTSQITKVMFESLFDLLLVLCYLVDISGKIDMAQADVIRIKVEFVPKIQETLTQWLVLHFLASTPTTPPIIEDFSSRLSSLHIGNNGEKRSVDENLGLSYFTLACLLDFPGTIEDEDLICSPSLPKPSEITLTVQNFCSLIIWGRTSNPMIELASLLLIHSQYEAAENLFLIIDTYSSKRRLSSSAQSVDNDKYASLHLLGFCLLARAQYELHGVLREKKVCEAIRCFFSVTLTENTTFLHIIHNSTSRVASGKGALQALQNLPFQTGFKYTDVSESLAAWKLHYYQWAMQMFERYGLSEGACQFALAALEQVDVVTSLENSGNDKGLQEAPNAIRGWLWGNVFKFFLDLKNYRDAYCAIISNPDEDSKSVNLRRFIIVLCEHGATKILCDGSLPLVGLTEKVEQELVWKAERSEVFANPNLYKLLYAFAACRNNWRKAATYMYRYSVRLKKEAASDDRSSLQERLNAISTTIDALQLVDSNYAWIESQHESAFCSDQGSPVKRTRNSLVVRSTGFASKFESLHYNVDVENLEKEYLLTSAQYLLTGAKLKYSGQTPEVLVGILIQENFYDMAFTIIMKFWRGSSLNKQLEEAFISISQQCCSTNTGPSLQGSNSVAANFLLPPSEKETYTSSNINSSSSSHLRGNVHWETLELYLENYRKLHPRLPATVAETLLHTDPQIDLPFWLVHMFKGGRGATPWGMTGQEADAATLFRLYVNYGRHAEATNLLLEYLESFALKRPADVINRKRMSAVWFPYTAIEQLWCQLVELQNAGQRVNQCDKLKELLRGALLNHLKQVKVDSEDAVGSACREEMQDGDNLS